MAVVKERNSQPVESRKNNKRKTNAIKPEIEVVEFF